MLRHLAPVLISLAVPHASYAEPARSPAVGPRLEQVAAFPHDRPTGVAVTPAGRIFVSLPYANFSTERHQATVVEVLPGGSTRPYPNAEWNVKAADRPIGDRFLNVQSVVLDSQGFLWALDTGSPKRAGIVLGGAKLVKIDPASDRVIGVVPIGAALTRSDSYPNDVRVDARRQIAYITDSAHGGIIVVDLRSGTARMTLADPYPPAMVAERRTPPLIEDVRIAADDGTPLGLATDGLALSPEGDTLYVAARPLAGSRRLYSIATRDLRDTSLSAAELAGRLTDAGPAVVTDGIEIGPDGAIYYSDLERGAISRARPGALPEVVLRSPTLRWPDGMAFGPDRTLFVTVAQFHLLPGVNQGRDRSAPPYLLLKTRY
jgi:sugar lactone lactonase YvrE